MMSKKKETKPKVAKRYTFIVEVSDDGAYRAYGKNEGFTATEILGYMYWKTHDIIAQLNGKFTPDIVERKVIKKK